MSIKLKEIWLTIYNQVNDHLRESDKKRDQIIAFYFVLLAALIGAWEKITIVQDIAAIFTFVTGLVCFIVVIQYRRWHIVYSCSMVTLQYLMVYGEEFPSLKECKDAWGKVNREKYICELINPFSGTETALTYLLVLMTLLPASLFLKNNSTINTIINIYSWKYIFFAAVYILTLVIISACIVKKYHKELQPEDWAFRWLKS